MGIFLAQQSSTETASVRASRPSPYRVAGFQLRCTGRVVNTEAVRSKSSRYCASANRALPPKNSAPSSFVYVFVQHLQFEEARGHAKNPKLLYQTCHQARPDVD